MDIIDINTANVHTAWQMFEALCKEQGTEEYLSADADKFAQALCSSDAILHGIMTKDGEAYTGVVFYFFGASPYSSLPFLSFKGLYIEPSYRHSGIAKPLMQELHMRASEKNCNYIQWNVVKENTRAVSYYNHLGFNPDPDPLLDYMEGIDDFIKRLQK